MTKNIYYPKNKKEYESILNNLKNFSLSYSLKNNLEAKNIIDLSYLNKLLKLNEDSVEFEAGENLYNIEKFLNTIGKTIQPFDENEIVKSIDCIKNNIYSIDYNIFDIYYSKRIYFLYDNLDILLKNIPAFTNFNIAIYNNFASFFIKYYKEMLILKNLWNIFKENFYYKANYDKRIKYLLMLKDFLDTLIYKNSIACNIRKKTFIPVEGNSKSFKRKKDNFEEILYFLKNEFDFIGLSNFIIELKIEKKDINKKIKEINKIKKILMFEIKISEKLEFKALVINCNKEKILSLKKQLINL